MCFITTKRKLTAKRKAKSEKLEGAFEKYLKIGNADKEPDEKNEKDAKENMTDENNNKDEKESNDKDVEENNAKDDKQEIQLESLELSITVKLNETIQPNTTESKEIYYNEELNETDDPATWTETISQQIRDYLVKKGPLKIILGDFPCQDDGIHFSKVHLKRKLSSRELIVRPWIIYSESKDRIFCFYCRLFSVGVPIGALVSSGLNNSSNILRRLPLYENSKSFDSYVKMYRSSKKNVY